MEERAGDYGGFLCAGLISRGKLREKPPALRVGKIRLLSSRPSGPMARIACVRREAAGRIWFRGNAPARSESMIFQGRIRVTTEGLAAGWATACRLGTRTRARLLRGFDENLVPAVGTFLLAAASKAFSLRSAASGMMVLTPSSVAFSMAHSKASNFTTERSSVYVELRLICGGCLRGERNRHDRERPFRCGRDGLAGRRLVRRAGLFCGARRTRAEMGVRCLPR